MKALSPLVKKRLRPLYIASFFQAFVLWYAIEKVFMGTIGLNNQAIAVETVIFSAVMLVINIPSGVLADRWSRKGVLMIASIFLITSSALGGLSHGFWSYTLAASCWGIFYACYLGIYDSIVYDTLLEEAGNTDDYELCYGRIQLYSSAALVLGSLISSVVTHYFSLRAAYFLTIPLSAISLIALWKFKEPRIHKKEVAQLMGAHIKETFKAILRRGQVVWIVLALIFITILSRIMFEFDQFWLIALALPLAFFGPVNAILLTSVGASAFIVHRIKDKYAWIFMCAVILLVAAIALTVHNIIVAVIASMLTLVVIVLMEIMVGRYLHDALPSRVRVGGASVVTTIGYGFFLPAGLLFGYLSNHFSVFGAAWLVVGLATAFLICISFILVSRKRIFERAAR